MVQITDKNKSGINSVELIYFSPTGTTRKVMEAIAEGTTGVTERIDLTPPSSGLGQPIEMSGDLTIIGSPVYGGRIPAAMVSRFHRIRGNNTPAVIVVLYGNRAYEDALLELKDLAVESGFRPIAAGAFIGEHSYSTSSMPVAAGRPDADDLMIAKEFGRGVREKMINMHAGSESKLPRVPGNSPYKERKLLANISPVTDGAACAKCGTCVAVCPTAAIVIAETTATDPAFCLRCCACIKNCPAGARKMEDQQIRQLTKWLTDNCRDRKEPETYL